MTELWLIGIGTGNPAHLTLEAAGKLKEAAVILVPEKGTGKDDLAAIRYDLIKAHGAAAHVHAFEMPIRDESLPYQQRVAAWHDEIALRWQAALEGAPEGPVALLVWGDPGLYDSTLRIAERLSPKPVTRVFPGITALQALTSAHAIPFNTVDGAVIVTTGRRLRDRGWPEGAESVVVMLDGQCSFQSLDADGLHIWWGGFLGMANQVLVSGALGEVTSEILDTRACARAEHGWIMDTYLLRKE